MKRLSASTYAKLYYASAASVPTAKRSSVAAAFLQLLRRHRALKLVPRILAHLQRLDDAANRTTRVVATVADRTDATQLEQQLTKAIGSVVLDLKVDPALRGGLVLRVGDVQVDGSLRSKLEQLHHHLTTS